MCFAEYFPIFSRLPADEQSLLLSHVFLQKIPKGTQLHRDEKDCLGLLLVLSGQLRVFMTSQNGREITIYRLYDRDICLFSASCIMKNIQFDLNISAERDTDVWIIPINIYKTLMQKSTIIANYTNEIMASRFTDVMWLIEQILWKSFDQRLANFLIEESNLQSKNQLHITHEQIAFHLGTAREVVTRMLKYFQDEGLVRLARGLIEITDIKKLNELNK